MCDLYNQFIKYLHPGINIKIHGSELCGQEK